MSFEPKWEYYLRAGMKKQSLLQRIRYFHLLYKKMVCSRKGNLLIHIFIIGVCIELKLENSKTTTGISLLSLEVLCASTLSQVFSGKLKMFIALAVEERDFFRPPPGHPSQLWKVGFLYSFQTRHLNTNI